MRPARTTKKTNPGVSTGKSANTTSSQGRRDPGAVVSKSPSQSVAVSASHASLHFDESSGKANEANERVSNGEHLEAFSRVV